MLLLMVYAIVLFVFGSAIGSFLNVVSLRYDPDKGGLFSLSKIGGRSRCSLCARTLSWYELVPIFSYIALLGRCRTCDKRLSLQYPIVEVLCGLTAVVVPIFLQRMFVVGSILPFNFDLIGIYLFFLVWIFILWTLLLISVIDIRQFVIPDELNLFIGVLGVFVVFIKIFFSENFLSFSQYFVRHYFLFFSPIDGIVLNHIIGFFVGGLSFLFIVFITRGRAMGMGDVKLMAVLGLAMGLPDITLVIFFSFVCGGIFGIFSILLGEKTMKSMIPFGPFIVMGVFIVVFLGGGVIDWYFSIFPL